MDKKPALVINACISSAMMYIEKAKMLGWVPIATFPYFENKELEKNVRRAVESDDDYKDAVLFFETEDVNDLFRFVSDYDVKCVVPGSDPGVPTADKLNRLLGLPGNDPETTWRRISKYGMYQSLKENGLRAIETRKITSDEDITSFWKENDLKAAIIKFTMSAGSFGVRKCNSEQESIDYYHVMKDSPNNMGVMDVDILIQEYIEGLDEYIVNTLSVNGRHRVTDMWMYSKYIRDGNIVYDRSKLLQSEDEYRELVDYALKVVDAVGMVNGLCHSEFKIDSKGPVLIETNPRLMGDDMTYGLQKEVLGASYADYALLATTDPDDVDRIMSEKYRALQDALIVEQALDRDIYADAAPMIEILKGLRSFRTVHAGKGMRQYRRTVDLLTNLFSIKLTDKDPSRLMKDFNAVKRFEKYPYLMLAEGPMGATDGRTDISEFFEGSTIAFYGKMSKTESMYDTCIIAATAGMWLQDFYEILVSMKKMMNPDGKIVITEEFCEQIPYGKEGLAVISDALGLSFEEGPQNSMIAHL